MLQWLMPIPLPVSLDKIPTESVCGWTESSYQEKKCAFPAGHCVWYIFKVWKNDFSNNMVAGGGGNIG